MAEEANFEGIQGAGADVAENDPERGDDQNTGLLFSVTHEKSFPHLGCGEPSHHT